MNVIEIHITFLELFQKEEHLRTLFSAFDLLTSEGRTKFENKHEGSLIRIGVFYSVP